MIENLEEREKQIEIINKLKQDGGFSDKKYYIETFGCQMNAHDSEKFIGILNELGLKQTDDINQANLVMYNTCCVRDNAERKVYGRIGIVKRLKQDKKDLILCICGCMMQELDVIEKMKKEYKNVVDIIFGTHNIYKFPELLMEYMNKKSQIIDIWDEYKDIVESLPMERKYKHKACVNIMYGCNNFCTYCIVPYVRGRERSRKASDIVSEVKELANKGVVEVMLLGQNVNSYGIKNDDDVTFARLLHMVSEVEGIERVRFMTPHPKDCSDELIEEIANNSKVCKQIHLPIQSGSTKVLKAMNRVYTKEKYLELIKKVKEKISDVSITTDIIVGFPGESEEDFCETLRVVEEVQYDGIFSFIYSKRTGTKAASMPYDLTQEVISNRFNRLLELDEKIKTERNQKRVGKIYKVLVDEETSSNNLSSRTEGNLLVHFEGTKDLIGKIVNVEIVEAKGHYMLGRLVK